MKHLLLVHHSQTGSTAALAQAVLDGARDPAIGGVELRVASPLAADAEDLRWADAVILGTPENFGYMSGALKDLFDRTFYACENKVDAKPYAVFVCAGNDGTGAVFNIDRICTGLKLKKVCEPVIARKVNTPELVEQARELGATLAAGVAFGIF